MQVSKNISKAHMSQSAVALSKHVFSSALKCMCIIMLSKIKISILSLGLLYAIIEPNCHRNQPR